MSFVISIISKDSFIIAGDTQLNNENGKIPETGIKVFPIDTSFVVGMTGDYKGNIFSIEELFRFSAKEKIFSKRVERLSQLLGQASTDSNALAAGLEDGKALFATLGYQTGWKYQIQSVSKVGDSTVRFLLPPNVDERIIYPCFNDISDLKNCVINCVRVVSRHSSSVNDKVFGVQATTSGLYLFTDNTNYDQITVRIDAISPRKQ